MLTATVAFAATSTHTDSVSGAEIYASSVEGGFTGTAAGSLPGVWYFDVIHTPLSGSPQTATITGGSLDVVGTLNGQGTLVTGTFASGSVTQTGGLTGCTDQTYAVVGSLRGVGPSGTSDHGTGHFDAVLTHYRHDLYGYCLTYSASIAGTVELSF